ncbi:aminoglycoside phosphotransferase family protein [Kribbella sp. NPDC006257]|uniref:aminoglycoside phosphotransferase family protein n=1 Tax=Kribbella sp. NPDC006257 TaxID=3156738 RepID=UPI0033AAEE48
MDETKVVDALVSVGGRYAGRLPKFVADRPWWAEIEAATRHLDQALGVRAVILRLVHADEAEVGRGGRAVYHVQAAGDPRTGVLDPAPLEEWESLVAFDPLRATWAEVDGPYKLISWAAGILGSTDWTQVKTWNLSCLIRFATDDGGAWAKATSRFCSVDADVIEQVREYDALLVPEVLGVDLENRWSLLRHVPGNDCWEPELATVTDVVSRWVAVQAAIDPSSLRTPRMLPEDLAGELAGLLAGQVGERLTPDEVVAAQRLVEELPAIVARLESAGLPNTLVHGDFHPGNWRSDGVNGRIVDWADSYIGHPATDIERLRGWLPAEKQGHAVETWTTAWKQHLPGCDPLAALEPIKVIARLLGAVTYQRFLDNIETSERIYHEDDPTSEVRAAIAAAGLIV